VCSDHHQRHPQTTRKNRSRFTDARPRQCDPNVSRKGNDPTDRGNEPDVTIVPDTPAFARDEIGSIHGAVNTGDPDVVRAFVDANPDVNVESRDHHNNTPLLIATKLGHLNVVRYLVIELGADLAAKGNKGRNCVFLAGLYGWVELLRFFVNECVKSIYVTDADGQSLLHTLAFADGGLCHTRWQVTNNAHMLGVLINEFGMYVDATNTSGHTVTQLAATRGRIDVMRLFVEIFHASVDVVDPNWRTLLHRAVVADSIDIVRYLDHRSDWMAKDIEQNTAIDLAVKCRSERSLKYIKTVIGVCHEERTTTTDTITGDMVQPW